MPLPPSGFIVSLNQMERRSRPISAESPAVTIGDGDDIGDGDRDDHIYQNSRKWYISNGGSSRVSVFSQGSLGRSINKDAVIACEKFGYKGTVFCGVFDGHGNHGHLASRMTRDRLPELVLDEICRWGSYKISRSNAHKQKYMGVYSSDYSDKHDCNHHHHATTIHDRFAHGHGLGRDVLGMWRESLCNAFERMDSELAVPSSIDAHLRATTSLILVKHGNHLILGHVGNSRAVLGTRAHDGSVVALQLTMGIGSEHKYRVKASSLPPPSVHSLCLPEKSIPGLARARAFDENRLDAYNGIITSSLKPDVMAQHLSKKDEFVVLATEGVWDILTNQEVVDTVASISDRSLAAEAVVSRAMGAWMARRADYLTDDCAVVCLFI